MNTQREIDIEKDIFQGIEGMYANSGEAVSKQMLLRSYDVIHDKFLQAEQAFASLEEQKKIQVMPNPYGTGEDYVGVYGGIYPQSFEQLMRFRSMRLSVGLELARKMVTDSLPYLKTLSETHLAKVREMEKQVRELKSKGFNVSSIEQSLKELSKSIQATNNKLSSIR